VKGAAGLGVRALGETGKRVAAATPQFVKSAGGVAAADALIQGGEMAFGDREEFDPKQTAISAVAAQAGGVVGSQTAKLGRGLSGTADPSVLGRIGGIASGAAQGGKAAPIMAGVGQALQAAHTPISFAAFGEVHHALNGLLGDEEIPQQDLPWYVDLGKLIVDSAVVTGISKVAPLTKIWADPKVRAHLEQKPNSLVSRKVFEKEAVKAAKGAGKSLGPKGEIEREVPEGERAMAREAQKEARREAARGRMTPEVAKPVPETPKPRGRRVRTEPEGERAMAREAEKEARRGASTRASTPRPSPETEFKGRSASRSRWEHHPRTDPGEPERIAEIQAAYDHAKPVFAKSEGGGVSHAGVVIRKKGSSWELRHEGSDKAIGLRFRTLRDAKSGPGGWASEST
jgi:hypothetical protein